MKKEKVTYYCDDCRKEIFSVNQLHQWIIKFLDKQIDICTSCLKERLSHSFSIVKDRTCDVCDGTGKITESYYHNERSITKCDKCDGKGILNLV